MYYSSCLPILTAQTLRVVPEVTQLLFLLLLPGKVRTVRTFSKKLRYVTIILNCIRNGQHITTQLCPLASLIVLLQSSNQFHRCLSTFPPLSRPSFFLSFPSFCSQFHYFHSKAQITDCVAVIIIDLPYSIPDLLGYLNPSGTFIFI